MALVDVQRSVKINAGRRPHGDHGCKPRGRCSFTSHCSSPVGAAPFIPLGTPTVGGGTPRSYNKSPFRRVGHVVRFSSKHESYSLETAY